MEVTLQEFNEVIAALEKGELRVARKTCSNGSYPARI